LHNKITQVEDAGTFLSQEPVDAFKNRFVSKDPQRKALKRQFPKDNKPTDTRDFNKKRTRDKRTITGKGSIAP